MSIKPNTSLIINPIADAPEAPDNPVRKNQWAVPSEGMFFASPPTQNTIPSGVYTVRIINGLVRLRAKTLVTDSLIVMSEGMHNRVLEEIETFWAKASAYARFGMVHRRGILLHGRQGCGKSCLVAIVARMAAQRGAVVIAVASPLVAIAAIGEVRTVEPNRPVVLIMEDIDGICGENEESLTQLLDGQDSVDNVLVLATTNHISRLPERIRKRARRFDLIIEMPLPKETERQAYLTGKLGDTESSIAEWVESTDGLGYDGLAEVILLVFCYGKTLDEAVGRVRNLTNT